MGARPFDWSVETVANLVHLAAKSMGRSGGVDQVLSGLNSSSGLHRSCTRGEANPGWNPNFLASFKLPPTHIP